MSKDEKNKILQSLTSRVSSGLYFVKLEYLNRHPTPDTAWIRNIYILLSFYTELFLKTLFVAKNEFSEIDDLNKKLITLGHNLEKIGLQIKDELSEFGIDSIKLVQGEYIFETKQGNFVVSDFTDIRYDFVEGKIRTLYGTEHDMFKKQIDILLKINQELANDAWK